jgi:hypothetical protein
MPQPAIAQSRVCSDCKTDKPLSDFTSDKARPLGKSYICKPCKSARNKKQKYGLSDHQYQEMVRTTPHCPICGSEEPLVIDHDHSTQEVRGLICNHCNLVLGHARDSIETLKNAIAYLEQ